MRRLALGIACAALPLAAARCALFYDLGTKGYSVSSEGGEAGSSEDCGADASCESPPFQLCEIDADCPDASCIQQTCTFGTTAVGLKACGVQALCTP
jgi:hypothetical protein